MKSTKITKLKEGEKVARNSAIFIFLLSLVESFIGFLSGSAILVSDGLHNIGDSMAGFASWFGLKISQRKPDEKFPYGYYKVETLTTLFVSILILYAAFELILRGYSKLFTISELTMPFQAMGIALVTMISSYFISKYMRKTGEKINSQSLIANSKERGTHVFSSAIAFVAIILTFYKVPYVEGIVTIIFSFLVLKIGIFSIKDSLLALMDVSPSEEIEKNIKKIIKSTSGVENFEGLRLRRTGPFIIGEVKIKTKKSLDVKRAHGISDKIEDKIKSKIEEVISFNIHIEPYKFKKQKIAMPTENKNGLKSRLSSHFGRAKYFILVNLNEKKIESYYFKENKYREIITGSIGTISFHTLRDHLIDIYYSNEKNVQDSISNFIGGKLKLLEKPTKELGQEMVEHKK